MVQIVFANELKKVKIELTLASWEITNFQILNTSYNFSPVIQKIIAELKSRYNLENIKEEPIVRLYRDFYWECLRMDPTKIRPASEALVRRILGDKLLPIISPFVDAYNWASAASLIPMGAYDISTIKLPIHIRFSSEKDIFHAIGKDPKHLEPEILVTADDSGQIICQYPYRDSQESMVTSKSTTILLLVYGIRGILKETLFRSIDRVKTHLDWLKQQKIIEYQGQESYYYHQSF
jgi:DNA/RNA-binding domain of Phe-tRNA-synthetase-like protein